jgi:hypothetical protein
LHTLHKRFICRGKSIPVSLALWELPLLILYPLPRRRRSGG